MGSQLGITPQTKLEVRLDGLGIFYIVFAVVWTLMLFAGMAYLWVKREMPILRIRGLGLSFAAIILLHCYWFCVTTGYVYAAVFPETAEYWIMGLWLPIGIALFHASNSRFLYVANAQKKYADKTLVDWSEGRPRIRKTLVARWKMLAYTQKMLILIGLGLMLQIFLDLLMFLISRKFHSSFGIPGTEVTGTPMEQTIEQGRGWEWWPSIFWQIFWAWVFAPIILWRSRNLRDTQGWRTQTIACCLVSLPASPMWLIALYVPAMQSVNKYFIPPQWIAVSIMFLEIFTVFVPIGEVRKQQNLCQETLDSIARWETRQTAGHHYGAKSLNSGTSGTSSWMGRTKAESVSTLGGSILTMDALEHTLAKNPEPLQEFSALRDFSGENIAFLTRIREWRAQYMVGSKDMKHESDSLSSALSLECFESALHIYIDFISANSAEFQVNLSSQDFKNLQAIFEGAAQVVCGQCNSPDPAVPFADGPKRFGDSSETIRYMGEIPPAFSDCVFDDAEMSIKYLVLTNTWPKFVKERRSFDTHSNV